jgi:D-alanyl-D-alanine carboxypeptidase/D-alanyl-D-alanine carboxypeptidase (penicillin-binding protein 5/6)
MRIAFNILSLRQSLQRVAAAIVLFGGLAQAAQAVQTSIVLDSTTGRVLSENQADEVDHPASLTKMMTMYLAFQALQGGRLTLDQQLPVSAHAASMAPTKLGLRAGQTISVRDCILGMITKSANDAATVMAEKLGGSESRFVEMMNAQAQLLGMSHTRFASASGLPNLYDGTTARDMSRLAVSLYRDFPGRVPMFATREFSFRGRVVRGHNHLMERYAGMDGLKTGYTVAAGFNLASTAVRDGHRLFGVVLGGKSARSRDDEMASILDEGFEQWQNSPTLIAAVGHKPDHHVAHVLAALSPIGTAEAEAMPTAASPRRKAGHRPSAKHSKTLASTKARHAKRHRKSDVRLASTQSKPAVCSTRHKSSRACASQVRAHGRHQPTRLAHREVKKHNAKQSDD